MGTNPGDRRASRIPADELEMTGSPNRWERKILSLLDEGEKSEQLETVFRALLEGAAIAIAHRSQDVDGDTLMAMRYLSEVCGLTQPGSQAN